MSAHPDQRITVIARTNFRNQRRPVGITVAARRHHVYAIGMTGTGKSTLLETMARQDIEAGAGFALFDPHGDLVERVVAAVPDRRRRDLIYFNVPDAANPLGFNPLERVHPSRRGLAASGMLEVFKKLWPEFWGPRLEHVLRNALLALLELPEATLADVLRLLDEPAFRKRVAERVANEQVRRFWLKEYEGYPARFRAEAIAPIQNKVGAFLADPVLQRILTQPRSSFDLRQVMDEGKILLVNLAKGKLGEDTAALLGSLLAARIGLAALSRADTPEENRPDFFVYMDEFHSFTTLALASMLSELRKYRVGLVLAQQYLSQVAPDVRDAVLGNVGTMIAFRLGPSDAELLEGHLRPEFTTADLMSLPNYNVYVRLMADGVVTRAFSAETISRRL